MADNLTKRFKAELADRGITASDTEINSFITNQPSLFQSVGQPMAAQPTGGRTMDWYQPTPEQKGSALDFVGAMLWRGLDAALLGVPGIALGEEEPYKWDTLGTGAKAGAVFGEALGFLAPLGVVSKAGRGIVSAVKGTGKMTREAIKQGGSAATAAGIEAGMAQQVIKKTLKNPIIKGIQLPKYAMSGDDIVKAEEMIRAGLRNDLVQEFPDLAASQLDDISEAVLGGLKSKGVHVNNIGHWLEKSLNTTFNIADKSKITRYAGRWAEVGTNFAVYNLLASGIQSAAGNQEFDPVSDVTSAFMFASLLPAVEMVGGGGKVKIIREATKLRKMLGKFDTKMATEYEKMSAEELNGLLKIMTRDNFLKDTLMGKEALTALRKTGGKDLAREDAILAMKKVAGKVDPKAMWKDFRSYAGEDFVQSLGRMMLGGFYFNSHTLLDYNLLKNMDPEILGAHILTGMMFTKTKKPLFRDPHPTLNDFQERRLALEYFGMDADAISAIAKSFTLAEHQGIAYAGIKADPIMQSIANIINTDIFKNQSSKLTSKPDRVTQRDNFIKWVFGLYNLHEISGRVLDANPEIPVALGNLTRRQKNNIVSKLEKIVIDKETGETLNADNFHSFRDKLFKQVLSGQHATIMQPVLEHYRDLGLQVDKLQREALDMDSPVRVEKLEGLERYEGKEGYEWLIKLEQIRDILEGAGFIETIKATKPRKIEDIDVNKLKDIQTSIEGMVETLKIENYGEIASGKESVTFVDPVDNGFLDALRLYKFTKNLSSAYNIVEGVNLTERERGLREALLTVIGKKVPQRLYNILTSVVLTKPKDMTQDQWDKINKEGDLDVNHRKLKNLLKMWGINKEDGQLEKGGREGESSTIDYTEALGLITLFEKEGFILTSDMSEQMNRYYWSRFAETTDIGIAHQVILDKFVAHGVGRFETMGGKKKVLTLPDRETVESILMRSESNLSEPEVKQLMKEWDAVTARIASAKGKFIQYRRKMKIEDIGTVDLDVAIHEAYTATESFAKDVTQHFETLRAETHGASSWIQGVRELLSSRKTSEEVIDPKTKETTTVEKTQEFRDNKEAEQFVAELDRLIEEGQKLKLVSSDPALEENNIQLLKDLRNKVVDAEGSIKELGVEYESSAQKIEELMKSEWDSNTQLGLLVEQIIFGHDNNITDRLLGRRRMETLQARLIDKLDRVGIKIEENAELTDIADLYANNPRIGMVDFVDQIAMSLRVWRKGYDEATWFETQKEFSEQWSDASGHNIDPVLRYSPAYVSQTYGRHNDSLKSLDWFVIQEEIAVAREAGNTSEVTELIRTNVVENVRQAILSKNTDGTGKDARVNREKADAEFIDFMNHVFPSYLANSIGTQKVESSTLDFDSNGNPLIITKSTSLGKGSISMFIDNMAGPVKTKIYDVVVDMYEHPTLKSVDTRTGKEDAADIWVVDNIAEARSQLTAIKAGLGKGKNFANRITREGDHHIIRHKYGDHKRIYIRGTEPEGLIRDVAGRKKGQPYIKSTDTGPIRVLRFEHTGVFNSTKQDVRNIDGLDSIIENANLAPGELNLKQNIRSEQHRGESTNAVSEPIGNVVRIITSYNNEFLVGLDGLRETGPTGRGVLNERFKVWYDAKAEQLAEDPVALRKLEALFSEFVEEGAIDSIGEPVRQMARIMYWDSVSSKSVTDLIKAADNKAELGRLGSSFFKKVVLAEATGAKTQGSVEFLKEARNFSDTWTSELKEAVDYSINKLENQGGYELVSLGDEIGRAFSSERLTKELLRKLKKEHKKGTPSYDAIERQIKQLAVMLPSMLDRSGVDGHTWLGTRAARSIYLHRGRVVGGDNENGKTAGVKPTGWFNSTEGTILMKTNFTYDPRIAEILDRLEIDMLSTESSTKEYMVDHVDIKAKDIKGAESIADILEMSGKFGEKSTLVDANNIARMGLENIFIGKTEDRHGITNVTYALSDFLGASGYKSHMESYVDYNQKIGVALGPLKALATGTNRNAAADFLMNTLRRDGALFEDSTTGLVKTLLESGVDPDSPLVRDRLQQYAMRHLVNQLRAPKTAGASYSVLIPFVEGTPTVYDGNRRIINGGKKLAFEDGNLNINNWNNVKYIISFSTTENGKRDLQAARHDKTGEWIITDPYGEVKSSDAKVKRELKRLEKLEKGLQDKKLNKYIHVFNKLNESNNKRKATDTKFYLHSLTLRMPNLGGDVAVHRIEGFYHKDMSNVTGINAVDLATIHQGDFDADMAFNYHDAPGLFTTGIAKFAGASKDAYAYKSEGPVVDIFNNGIGLSKAGSSGDTGDTMHQHVQKALQADKNFGAIKRMTAGLSALDRMGAEITNQLGSKVVPLEISNNASFNGFLQRYKNVLQSIIDAKKEPNFVSEAKDASDIMKFILFNEPFPGSEEAQNNLEKYGEGEYKPFFEIDSSIRGSERAVLMDAIIESINVFGRPSRFLSDVWDESGRRPPDANEVMGMRSSLYRFTQNPNKQLMISLLTRYSSKGDKASRDKVNALLKLFYGKQENYRDVEALRKAVFNRKLVTPNPDVEVIYLPDNLKGIKKGELGKNPGIHIVKELDLRDNALLGWSTTYNEKASLYNDKITKLLDDVEVLGAITDNTTQAKLLKYLSEGDVPEKLEGRLSGDIINVEGTKTVANIQNYSILYHILQNQRRNVAGFIRSSGKSSPNQVARARARLRALDAVTEYLDKKEWGVMEGVLKETDGKRHKFYFTDYDFTKVKNGRQRVHENKTDNVHYIYKVITEKGITKYKQAGWVKKGSKKFLAQGKYVVLKNPIRYEKITERDRLDGWALMQAVGRATADNIHLMPANDNVINRFIFDVDKLKKDIGTLAKETYEISKKSAHQMENWMFESKQEDALVNEFMKNWLDRRNMATEGANPDTEARVQHITEYLMRPRLMHGQLSVATVSGKNIPFPQYQTNKRIVGAMARWLKNNNQQEIFDHIFTNYGKHYRRMKDNLITEEMSQLHTSDLYHRPGGPTADRSPIIDLVFEKNVLYQPNLVASMLHITRKDLKRFADRTRYERDSEGELILINQYGNSKDVIDMLEVYEDPRKFIKEEKTECA